MPQRHGTIRVQDFRLVYKPTHKAFRLILYTPPIFFLKWLDFVTHVSHWHFGSHEDHFSLLAMTAGDYGD